MAKEHWLVTNDNDDEDHCDDDDVAVDEDDVFKPPKQVKFSL